MAGRGIKGPHDQERADRMCSLYRSGRTLQEIGTEYGLTRERVRQIISREGVGRTGGGAHIVAVMSEQSRLAGVTRRRNTRAYATYGCDYDTLVRLNRGHRPCDKGSLTTRYHSQKNNARTRGIGWQLTFPEWVGIWESSGHLETRGRTAHEHVMARHGDVGPYAIGNVYVTTLAGNASDYQAWRRGVRVRPIVQIAA